MGPAIKLVQGLRTDLKPSIMGRIAPDDLVDKGDTRTNHNDTAVNAIQR